MDNFYPYNGLFAIDTNIPQRLQTGFVLQGHINITALNMDIQYVYIYIIYMCM